ncbi:MAG: hypothetical protein IJM27_06670 [Eubacterium sp.]|nr:hypothetical protein [Eubacterium sp.]
MARKLFRIALYPAALLFVLMLFFSFDSVSAAESERGDSVAEDGVIHVTFDPNGGELNPGGGWEAGHDFSKPHTLEYQKASEFSLLGCEYWKNHVFRGWKVMNGASKGKLLTLENGTKGLSIEDGLILQAYWVKVGWNKDGDRRYYVKSDGTRYVGQMFVGKGVSYYFDKNGYTKNGLFKAGKWIMFAEPDGRLFYGWKTIDGSRYYFQPSCSYAATGMMTIDDKDYYFDENGIMQVGWIKYQGDWFYFRKNGVQASGWLKIGDARYYLDPTRVSGLRWFGNKLYLFDEDGKWIQKSGWAVYKKKTYFIKDDHTVFHGMLKYKGSWYNMTGDNGIESGYAVSGWYKNGFKFHSDKNGKLDVGWTEIKGKKYRFSKTGEMITGWTYDKGKYYYLLPSGGVATGWKTIKGKKYFFNSKGELKKSPEVYRVTFLANEKTGTVNYGPGNAGVSDYTVMVPKGSSIGESVYGLSDTKTFRRWKTKNGKTYSQEEVKDIVPKKDMVIRGTWIRSPIVTVDLDGGTAKKTFGPGESTVFKGKFSYRYKNATYLLDWVKKKGYRFMAWYVVKGTKAGSVIYDLSENYIRPTKNTTIKAMWYKKKGWNKINKRWYYVEKNGDFARQFKTIGGKTYYFGDSGLMKTGWKKVGGLWYYFDKNGAMVTGTKKIGGKTYRFDEYGIWIG